MVQDKTSHPPLVLIANDQEWSARSLESILGPAGYSVVRAYTGQQALERARTAQPDLVILDAQLPDMHGFEVCRAIRADARLGVTTPIVITTSGPSGRTQRLEAYHAGAWEFLGQPIDGEALLLRLGTFLQNKQEIDSHREERLVDPATGLYNMRGLARRAREIGAAAFRRRDPVACAVFSPELAPGNDDAVAEEEMTRLADQVGMLVQRAGRASDVIGRLGQVEFAVIAPGTGTEGVARMAARLTSAVETSPIPVRGGERAVRLRAGYCAVPDFADSPIDAVELLLRATTALRDLQKEGNGERMRAFDSLPLQSPA